MITFRTHEIYAQLTLHLDPNSIILEAGACDGRDTQKLAAAFPNATIHSFEPVPELFAMLLENTRDLKNVHCYQVALSDHIGSAQFHLAERPEFPGKPTQAGSLHAPKERLKWSDLRYPKTITVPTTTIDAWAKEQGITTIDFMWLDMQGHELQALKGAERMLQRAHAIYVEVNFIEAYENQPLFPEVAAWIAERDFQEIGRNFKNQTEWFFGNVFYVKK
jgi:FkbM family methyltransferase